jgi:hypothetical protein
MDAMRLALALLVLATLSGCTVKYDLAGADWKKPNTMLPQTTQDEMDCVRDAREAGWTQDLIVGGLVDIARWTISDQRRLSSYRRCMVAKGYQPS